MLVSTLDRTTTMPETPSLLTAIASLPRYRLGEVSMNMLGSYTDVIEDPEEGYLLQLEDVQGLFAATSMAAACPGEAIIQTPLRAGVTRDGDVGPEGVNERFIRNAAGRIVFCASEGSLAEGRAVARRIAACLNACAGIPTECLEAIATGATPAVPVP